MGAGLILLARDKFDDEDAHTSSLTSQEPQATTNSLSNDDYCFTKGCIQTAADLLDKLDQRADPCQDFYQFACGTFIQETVIPDDRTRTSMFSILGDKLDLQVRGLLEGEIKPDEPKPFRMAKAVFQSCMDRVAIEAAGLEPLKEILKKMGGWP